jgi:hypothetical protein
VDGMIVEMKVVRGVDVSMHIDDAGDIVIDRCEGMDSADAVQLFDPWISEAIAMAKADKA